MPHSLNDYDVLSTIGSGSYGTCKKIMRKKDNRVMVWKELDYATMTETEKQMLVSEVNLLRDLKHQHIVRYYDRIIDRARSRLYIVMEYCEGGDLSTYIARLKKERNQVAEEFVWKICTQVTMALKECHNRTRNGKAVLHRDLKPANVFLDNEENVKLGDFGLARVLNHDTSFATTFVGTPYYMSPEQMKYTSYNEKSDIWALGCLLYELCALRPPFTASNQRELASKICTGIFNRIPLRYTDELNDMIGQLLTVEEHRRPSIEQFLRHPSVLSRVPAEKKVGLERRPSACSDEGYEGYGSKYDSLRQREEALNTREQELNRREVALQQRQIEFEEREKNLVLREENLSRFEKKRKEFKAKMDLSTGEINDASDSDSSVLSNNLRPRSSCISKTQRLGDSPKKKVSFNDVDKENAVLYPGVSKGLYEVERRMELDRFKYLLDVKSRLRQTELPKTRDYTSQYNRNYLMGFR